MVAGVGRAAAAAVDDDHVAESRLAQLHAGRQVLEHGRRVGHELPQRGALHNLRARGDCERGVADPAVRARAATELARLLGERNYRSQ